VGADILLFYLISGQMSRRAMKLRRAAAPAHRSANANAIPAISKKCVDAEPASRSGPNIQNIAASAPRPAP
jgi:hypothetical protein